MAIFPGEPGVSGFSGAKDDGSDGDRDNRSYKLCKVPVKSSPPTSQHRMFFTSESFQSHPTNSVTALKDKKLS